MVTGGWMKLLPLVSKRMEDLTLDELDLVKATFNIDTGPVNEELRLAALGFLSGLDINHVADLIKDPEAITQLIEFFKHQKSVNKDVHEVDEHEEMGAASIVSICPRCDHRFVKF